MIGGIDRNGPMKGWVGFYRDAFAWTSSQKRLLLRLGMARMLVGSRFSNDPLAASCLPFRKSAARSRQIS